MGDSISTPIKQDHMNQYKQNKPPTPKLKQLIPNLGKKAKFTYIPPLIAQIEEFPEQETFHPIQNSFLSQKSGTTILPSQTCFSLIHAQQIKVKWNSFAKMKNRNYLQDYQVIRKIGKGGFGVVSKVKSIHTQVFRAAKVIKKKQLKQNDHKKLLEQLSIMRSLDHPNIIKIYEVYDYENQYTLILQLTSGGQLAKKMKGKKISQKVARIYMRQIIRTLIYIHSQGIVHRDLKPQNMLFQTQGSNFLKIIDFGIATRLQTDQILTDRIGTPFFLAPQVIYKHYNQKCDIWSAGVIFYMMLTGVSPFKAENEVQLLNNILRQQPKFNSSSFKNLTPQCVQLLKLMLQKKPEKRPQASQILSHKWFQIDSQNTQIVQKQKGSQILLNIRKFNFRNKLQAVVHTFIASQLLNKQQKSLLVELFRQLDINNDGVISTDELKQALSKKKKISNQRVQLLMNIIDTNCSGQIQYTQFLVAGLSNDQFMKREHFQKAFAYFDIDHSGKITYQQVLQFLQNYQQSQEQIQILFKQVDANGDGQIDKQQFIQLFINRTSQLKILYQNTNQKQIQSQNNMQIKTLKKKRQNLRSQKNLNDLDLDSINQVG